jgi:hypothetical protein
MQEVTVATLYLADKKRNNFMRGVDLCPQNKAYVTDKETIRFKTSTLVNRQYWLNIIEKSKAEDDFWIPAIEHDGILYVSPEIMELSDGKQVMFVTANAA